MSKCVFCGIVDGSVPSDMVYEDDQMFIINDIDPWAPVHLLAIPKEHIPSLIETNSSHEKLLSKLLSTLRVEAQNKGLDKTGYRVVINSGEDALQTVPHLHVHLLGGEKLPSMVKSKK